MNPTPAASNLFERYDRGLRYAHDKLLPPDHPRPKPTTEWSPENQDFYANYERWLLSGGTSEEVTHRLYLPMAGHVLGLFMRPHEELDLDTDLQVALDYVIAKRVSDHWIKASKIALDRFRRFLMQERGIEEVTVTPYNHKLHTDGLPDWLVEELKYYQITKQRNWRPARLEDSIRRFWSGHLRTWRFLCGECGVVDITDLNRRHIFRYMEFRLKGGYSPKGVNGDVRSLRGFLGFLQDQGYSVPQTLFRVPGLKEPERLPRFLTDEQVDLLRDDFENRVRTAGPFHDYRDAVMDRAVFYLLWQGALRLGEAEELRLEDLDLDGRTLIVRGKGQKDRTVYLTDKVVFALEEYLKCRGPAPSDHVFTFRNRALRKGLIPKRIKAAGKRVGVKVSSHRLRHTSATQLLNADCRVTSIQRFLGHKRLNTTMVYANVHDHKVAEDYYAAMEKVEKLMALDKGEDVKVPIGADQREQLLKLTEQLADPDLIEVDRVKLIDQIRAMLE